MKDKIETFQYKKYSVGDKKMADGCFPAASWNKTKKTDNFSVRWVNNNNKKVGGAGVVAQW